MDERTDPRARPPEAWHPSPPSSDAAGEGSASSPSAAGAGLSRSPHRPRWRLAALLFLATCATTTLVGGPSYSACLMAILLAHELGHYLQARRHRHRASLPYFLPAPLPPLGTFGAVILMAPGQGNRRELFDIAVTGPLAGLVPAIIASLVGIHLSKVAPIPDGPVVYLGEPLLFQLMVHLVVGPLAPGTDLFLHPVALAGWVGIFVTGLNLIPVGQLDGGHVIFALLGPRARRVTLVIFIAGAAALVATGSWGFSLLILLIALTGPMHPPTSDDATPLDAGRATLAVGALILFVFLFTPNPFSFGG